MKTSHTILSITVLLILVLVAGSVLFSFPRETFAVTGFTKAQTGVATNVSTGQTAITCTFASNPAQGDLVTLGVLFSDTGTVAPTFTVADGNGNSYTIESHNSGSTNMDTAGYVGQAYLLYAPANANKAITATFNKSDGPSGAISMWCDDWTPSGGASAYDSGNVGNGTGTINTPTITVSGTNELVYCTASDAASVGVANSPFTLNEGGNQGGNQSEWAKDLSADQACAYAGTAGQVYNAVGMSFKITVATTRIIRLRGGVHLRGGVRLL